MTSRRARDDSTGLTSRLDSFSLEERLLLVSGAVPGQLAEPVNCIPHVDLDWEYLIRSAHRHGMLALLWRRVVQPRTDLAPERWRTWLLESSRQMAAWADTQAAELLGIMAKFDAAGVPVFTVRGPTLALQAYGDIAVREVNGLNFVIRSSDVVVAREILFRDGYLPAYTFRSGQAVAQIRFLRACRLDRPGDRMHIWLQTEIEPGCFARRLDFARLEHRARMLRLGLGTVCTIGPEDLLLT